MNKLINLIPNKLLAIGAVAAVIVIALFSVDYYQKSQQVEGLSDSELLKASKENIVDFQVINSNGNSSGNADEIGDIVKYQYVSNQEVPPQTYKGLKEDLAKRTGNSVTFLESVKPINEKLQEEKYVSRFYSGRTWQKSGNNWYQIETATTTKTAFFNQTKLTILDQAKEFFGRKALADTFYAGAGDGQVEKSNSDVWATTHDATAGESASPTGTTADVKTYRAAFTSIYNISRSFLPFDTSAISSDATIVSATLSVYSTVVTDGNNDGNNYDYLNIIQTTQPNSTTFTTADYDLVGTVSNPTTGAASIDITGISVGYTPFTLNATGLGWITKNGVTSSCGSTAGVTCLGLREGHDLTNTANDSITVTGVTISTSEETAGAGGVDQDPYLSVTYTVIAPSKVIIDGGTIKVDGGTLKID